MRYVTVDNYVDNYFSKSASKFLNCSAFFNNSKDSIDVYVNRGRLRIYPDDPKDLAMDCDSMHSRIHGDISNFSQLKRSVAFVRNIYNSYELQEIFISTNYHPNQTFCHVLDKKSSEDFKRKMRKLDDCFDNILVLDKELDFDSKGHEQDRGHFLCLEAILNRKWNHALLLQNYDLVSKSNVELAEISEILDISSIVEMNDAYTYRYNVSANWTPHGLKLFKNETGVPYQILHGNLTIRKNLNEVVLSKVFVDELFEKLNLDPIIEQFNNKMYYGVDEMLVQTLYASKLGLKGQMISNCTKYSKEFSRMTQWNFSGPNGYDKYCKSKWKRHGICILGVEYLELLANTNALTANKVMADVDMGTPICMHEFLLGKLDRKPTFNDEFVRQYPQVRELAQIANRTFNPANFNSDIQFLNCNGFFNNLNYSIDMYVNRGRLRIYPDDPKDLAMDCDSMHSRIHGDISNFSQLKRSVAFVRNIYNSYELQEIFISTNYHPNQTFCHVLDKKSSEDFKRKMRKLDDCFDNILVLDKELDFDSKGHEQDRGHFLCLEAILNRNWNHALLLQNYDLVVKSNEELSEISGILNISSLVEMFKARSERYKKSADWTPHGLKLFKNETGISKEILHKNLTIRKNLNEVFLSKVFLEDIFDKLNLENLIKRFDNKKYFGVDEMLVQTLYASKLGLKGQMISNCSMFRENVVRYTHWEINQKKGFDEKCKSKKKRHGICIMGIEYLKSLININALIANKVMADVDMGTPICMHEFLLGKLHRKPTFNHKFVRQYPQVRELAQIANRTFNPANFKCAN
ncbi:unnamed protein product [Caenorhabditis bovis]|uniref:Uncharacterized protein n=1 Tax=Caenorhabditis bovis TaxID=2654633 RepID=A0A8S1E6K4_9PELO|nr:unnamed protein product [Caenorhabditis bovis]